ncbi:TPA: hypothetical protein ACTXXA_002556 [Legionella anisa]
MQQNDIDLFEHLLYKETQYLKEIESQGLLCEEPQWQIGLELEGWFIDRTLMPQPLAPKMIAELNQPELSEEITQDVFEINLNPISVQAGFLTEFDKNLTTLYKLCNDWASQNNTQIITIGMLPHLSPNHFKRHLLTNNLRHHVLNELLLKQRDFQPWSIKIEGEEIIELTAEDICLEAATTSTQFHLKVPQHQMVRTYNCAQLLAAPMVALAANAPYFNSKSLWQDTRIPWVQQTVSEQLPPNCWINREDRVLFGHGYVQNSITELFQSNLKFSSLAPTVNLEKADLFHHLKQHNGTIWRWNRPVVGACDQSGAYHIRLEHRVQSAGTSPSDIAAQLGFYIGILAYWQLHDFNPVEKIDFQHIRNNFYKAARFGLQTEIVWENTRSLKIFDLLHLDLLPKAKLGLFSLGLSTAEIAFYLDEILNQRLKQGLSGAIWQQQKVKKYGSVQTMLEQYHAHQQTLKPLWCWD